MRLRLRSIVALCAARLLSFAAFTAASDEEMKVGTLADSFFRGLSPI